MYNQWPVRRALLAGVFAVAGACSRDVPARAEDIHPTMCGRYLFEAIAQHAESPGSEVARVSCLHRDDQVRLLGRSHTYTSPYHDVWLIEFRGPYSNLRTGISGHGCWFRAVDPATGRVAATGGGPCEPPS